MHRGGYPHGLFSGAQRGDSGDGIYEFDQEVYDQVIREEAYEDGIEEGEREEKKMAISGGW